MLCEAQLSNGSGIAVAFAPRLICTGDGDTLSGSLGPLLGFSVLFEPLVGHAWKLVLCPMLLVPAQL